MTRSKPDAQPAHLGTRDRVLAAAEHLLGEGAAEFSMRDLATAAGVSFATPFNQFGSKLAIMRALSAERIECMHHRAAATLGTTDTVERVLAVVAVAAAVMVERPGANKAVMAAIGSPGDEAGDIRERSRALWSIALGNADGLSPAHRALGRLLLPDQLAIAFRGVLSFWTAGEIRDEDLQPQSVMAAATALLGFVDQRGRERLIALLRSTAAAGTA